MRSKLIRRREHVGYIRSEVCQPGVMRGYVDV
jgi:hypothetical protein